MLKRVPIHVGYNRGAARPRGAPRHRVRRPRPPGPGRALAGLGQPPGPGRAARRAAGAGLGAARGRGPGPPVRPRRRARADRARASSPSPSGATRPCTAGARSTPPATARPSAPSSCAGTATSGGRAWPSSRPASARFVSRQVAGTAGAARRELRRPDGGSWPCSPATTGVRHGELRLRVWRAEIETIRSCIPDGAAALGFDRHDEVSRTSGRSGSPVLDEQRRCGRATRIRSCVFACRAPWVRLEISSDVELVRSCARRNSFVRNPGRRSDVRVGAIMIRCSARGGIAATILAHVSRYLHLLRLSRLSEPGQLRSTR